MATRRVTDERLGLSPGLAGAELASLLTALLDFWRDPNRRLPHDRLAGTLVIRR